MSKQTGKGIGRLLLRIGLVLTFGVIAALAFVKFEYGRGTLYSDIGSANPGGLGKLEKLVSLEYPPGNVAVAPNGHVYFNYHPIARAGRFSDATVFELADGKITPFPSMAAQKDFQG
ncbi:MAG: hypothetical protein E5X17_02525, partial [Mesorhizobium sp.]